jgi:hypothetical protein
MKCWSRLPKNRESEGTFWITDSAGATIFGPVRARGEADNSGAAAHGNVIEDPTKAYGDHPSGLYAIIAVVHDPVPAHSYGPVFLKLDPRDGEALTAKLNGRAGIGIHGGDPGPGGGLRSTFGCLRLTNEAVQQVGQLVQDGLAHGIVQYECLIISPEVTV